MSFKYYESPFQAIEDDEEATESVLKTNMIITIRNALQKLGWSKFKTSKALGINQRQSATNGSYRCFDINASFSKTHKQTTPSDTRPR